MKRKLYTPLFVFLFAFCLLNLNCIGQAYNSSSLPIIWGNLTSKRVNVTTNIIEWKTIAETNSSHYNVQRSSDGIYFKTIGEVNGKGNISSSSDYSFVDKQAFEDVYYYRIQQVEINNIVNYSSVIKNGRGGKRTLVGNINPNLILVQNFSIANRNYRVINNTGNNVMNISSSVEQQLIDINSLAPGVYFLQIISSDGFLETHRFLK